MRALLHECVRRGRRCRDERAHVEQTSACLFNSFNFDGETGCDCSLGEPGDVRMVHRVGAVTSLYRGVDDGTDAFVASLNASLADATIAISHATIDMYRAIGIELVDPRVIYNPCDPTIFNPHGRIPFSRDRKTSDRRLVLVAESEEGRVRSTDGSRTIWTGIDYELTFVGNASTDFTRLRHLPPMPSTELAELLRTQDVFLTATENDAYSNALVEALSCGLPGDLPRQRGQRRSGG